VDVVVDEIIDDWAICHSEQLCPTVDPIIYISSDGVKIGEFYKVKLVKLKKYDYIGEIL